MVAVVGNGAVVVVLWLLCGNGIVAVVVVLWLLCGNGIVAAVVVLWLCFDFSPSVLCPALLASLCTDLHVCARPGTVAAQPLELLLQPLELWLL